MRRLQLIGPGEVGRRLAGALRASGVAVQEVTRTSGWDAASDPGDDTVRLVAVREEDLGAVLDRLAAVPRERLLLVQNGFLEVVHGDLGPVSRGLIWFTSKGEFFASLRPSLFHGPLAEAIVPPLSAGGLAVERIDDRASFLREMVLKGIWNCVVGLPLAVHGVTLGEYLERHDGELEQLLDESAAAASAEYGVEVTADDARACLARTTGPVQWVRGGVKALPWRNGAIVEMGRRHGIPTPVNERLIRAATS